MMNNDRPLRVAWFGEARDSGGVPGMGALLLDGLLARGVQIDWYTSAAASETPKRLQGRENLTAMRQKTRWQWNRWYSRTSIRAFISSLIARRRAYQRLCSKLLEENRRRPYDVIFQVSQTELFKLGKHLHELPPVVVYPCVHAAGELRWHRNESRYARKHERALVHYGVRCFLRFRSIVQKSEVQKPNLIIGMSRRFNELVAADYGVQPGRQAVLYHPIELSQAERSAEAATKRPIRLLFVARISVRKGVEQIIELSHRLDDLAGAVELHVIGGATMWSDYRGHLADLNPRIARYLGSLPNDEIMRGYDAADILVLPSHYEPGGIVVGEALSRGVAVVVSDEIGSAEPVSGSCCRRFPAGDISAFEREVRQLIEDVRADPTTIRKNASQQARQHFAPEKVATELLELLHNVAKKGSGGPPSVPRSSLVAATA